MRETHDAWNEWWKANRSTVVTMVPACGRTFMVAAGSLNGVDPGDDQAVKVLFSRVVRARRTLLHAVAGLESVRDWLGERELKRLPDGWSFTSADADSEPPDTDGYHAWAWLSDNALRFRDVGDALHALASAAEGAHRATENNYDRRASDIAAAVFELQVAIVRIDPTSWIKNKPLDSAR